MTRSLISSEPPKVALTPLIQGDRYWGISVIAGTASHSINRETDIDNVYGRRV